MKRSDFWFDLPEKQIAQTPVEPRDHSRLLLMNRTSGACSHHHFYDIVDLLQPGDLLVVNDSRVIPARETLVKPGKKAKPGVKLTFGDGLLHGEVLETVEGGNRLIRFSYEGESIYPVLEQIGNMPLPPYITQKLEDNERYQTVYSHELGSAAAPTAGLHFTNELLEKIKAKGVNIATVTLHVGLGTFRPVKEDEITDHKMHSEHYYLPQRTADLINQTKQQGGRVIAVGTTSCRTLETLGTRQGLPLHEQSGYTDIFIYPGYQFKVLDGLITNFHLPESTLIMLVSAFAGYEHTMAAYELAVKENYRFFSFGDAMAIL